MSHKLAKMGETSMHSKHAAACKAQVKSMGQEEKPPVTEETRAFQHGFVVGFMNGARVATEAFNAAIEEAVDASIQGNKATQVYLGHSCRSPICFNYRPGSTRYCSPDCEAMERAWGSASGSAHVIVN